MIRLGDLMAQREDDGFEATMGFAFQKHCEKMHPRPQAFRMNEKAVNYEGFVQHMWILSKEDRLRGMLWKWANDKAILADCQKMIDREYMMARMSLSKKQKLQEHCRIIDVGLRKDPERMLKLAYLWDNMRKELGYTDANTRIEKFVPGMTY